MVEQLAWPQDKAEIYWFSEHITDGDLEKYDSGR